MTEPMIDVVHADGTHDYWSTHCRHGNHEACSATELAPGVPRRPAQCKTCGSPCRCTCGHGEKPLLDVSFPALSTEEMEAFKDRFQQAMKGNWQVTRRPLDAQEPKRRWWQREAR